MRSHSRLTMTRLGRRQLITALGASAWVGLARTEPLDETLAALQRRYQPRQAWRADGAGAPRPWPPRSG